MHGQSIPGVEIEKQVFAAPPHALDTPPPHVRGKPSRRFGLNQKAVRYGGVGDGPTPHAPRQLPPNGLHLRKLGQGGYPSPTMRGGTETGVSEITIAPCIIATARSAVPESRPCTQAKGSPSLTSSPILAAISMPTAGSTD